MSKLETLFEAAMSVAENLEGFPEEDIKKIVLLALVILDRFPKFNLKKGRE